jgi:hypothetical protein
MKYLKNHKYLWLVIMVALISGWTLLKPGYFNHHDNIHFIRVFEMRECFKDLQIPCRWTQHMAYGYGQPMFNYYSVFPYYATALISYLTGYLWSVKIAFLLTQVLAGVGMYLIVKELVGKKEGLVSSVVYIFAPYHALDIFVRGAMAESFAIAFIPFAFYFSLKLIKKYSSLNFLGLTVFLAVFLTSHNISTLITFPIFLIWCILLSVIFGRKNLIHLLISLALSIGVAAFFLIPAYAEKDLIKSFAFTWSGLDFRIHFVNLRQLFLSRSWGYGSSDLGVKDDMSFQVGQPMVTIIFLSIAVQFYKFIQYLKKSKKLIILKSHLVDLGKAKLLFYIFFLTMFLVSAFMTHFRSAYIWESITILRFVQFPWRFLLLATFSAAVISGLVANIFENRVKIAYILTVIALAVVLNINYFKPQNVISISEQEVLANDNFTDQQKGAVWDYLPLNAQMPEDISIEKPEIPEDKGVVENYSEKSGTFAAKVTMNENSRVVFPVYDFPVWKVRVDGLEKQINASDRGLISIDLEKGSHAITGKFTNTPIREWANIISILSIFLTFAYIYAKSTKNIK